jgi:hypothetical protein
MTDPPNTSKARRFRFWIIGILIVILSASVVFVIQVGKGSSEQFISVSLAPTNLFSTIEAISIGTSNRMSFDVKYLIESEVLLFGDWTTKSGNSFGTYRAKHRSSYIIPAHSQKREVFIGSQKGLTIIVNPDESFTPRAEEANHSISVQRTKYSVSYERKLKPFEVAILDKLPWLKEHYPLYRRRSFILYEPVTNVQASSESKQQP